jgi:hypothetical protein
MGKWFPDNLCFDAGFAEVRNRTGVKINTFDLTGSDHVLESTVRDTTHAAMEIGNRYSLSGIGIESLR